MNSAPAYKWWGEFTRELDRIIQDETAITALADVLPDCNIDIRRWFAAKIGKIRPALVPGRLGFLTNDPDEDVQIAALTAYHAANALNEKTLNLVRKLLDIDWLLRISRFRPMMLGSCPAGDAV